MSVIRVGFRRALRGVTRGLLQQGVLIGVRRRSIMSRTVSPVLSVLPTRVLVDEKIKVMVENLPPGCPVTIRSLHHSEDEDYWEAFGHYVSDHRGVVSVSEDLSFGGTYSGIEPMGLVWSMRPVPGSRSGLRLRKLNVCTPLVVTISVHSGHEGFRDQAPLVSALVERWYMAPGVQRIEIKDKEVQGTLFIPPGPGPFPGLVDIWGGGGGLLEYRSALLASRGYVSLALRYLSFGELESADVEFSYFERAFNVVKDHPQVMSDRVGFFGLSLGSLVSLYIAAESTSIKPRCIICISTNYCHRSGATLRGITEELVRNFDRMRLDEHNNQIWKYIGMSLIRDPSKNIDVRKINIPVLLINGCDDQNWPSVETAQEIAQTMRAAGKEHLLSVVNYPDTGHLIEPPYSPHFRVTNFMIHVGQQKVKMLWGGQTKPHSDAQVDSWKKILSFLHRHMCSPSSKAKM